MGLYIKTVTLYMASTGIICIIAITLFPFVPNTGGESRIFLYVFENIFENWDVVKFSCRILGLDFKKNVEKKNEFLLMAYMYGLHIKGYKINLSKELHQKFR